MRALGLGAVLLFGCDPSVIIGAPNDGGADAGMQPVDAGPQIVGGCPRVRLGRSTNVSFTADTSTLTNIVQSPRLEWTDAPDDSLEFVAEETGNYLIELSSSNDQLTASSRAYSTGMSASMRVFTSADCPSEGLVVSIDGIYNFNQPSYPTALTAGQSMVIFISAPYWAAMKTGTYTVVVKRVP